MHNPGQYSNKRYSTITNVWRKNLSVRMIADIQHEKLNLFLHKNTIQIK